MDQTVVLLAEDEPIIRDVIAFALQRQNFIVLSACDAADAVQIFQKNRHVDVLLTDVHLGGGANGLELAEYIQTEKPATKALVVSGFPDSERMAAEKGLPFLRKPFSPKDLVARICELIGTKVSPRPEKAIQRRTMRDQSRSSPLPRAKSRAA